MDSVTVNASSNHITTCLWVRQERIYVTQLNLILLEPPLPQMGSPLTVDFCLYCQAQILSNIPGNVAYTVPQPPRKWGFRSI